MAESYKILYEFVWILRRIANNAEYIYNYADKMANSKEATTEAICNIDLACRDMREQTQKALKCTNVLDPNKEAQ